MALIEVAISMGRKDPSKLTELHYQVKKQAQEGLNETRRVLAELRSSEVEQEYGIKAIQEIVNTYVSVTNVKVKLNLGNRQWSYGNKIDFTIYRIVQESLTNSFRHGHATQVTLSFWQTDDQLIVNVEDNGKGAAEVEKGIGLAGMDERLKQIGGTMAIGSNARGFRLSVLIPLNGETS